MYIGKVSNLTGATPKAIRLYEQLGLIPKPIRKGKYRFYTDHDVELIKIIKEAQKLGFKLAEMKTLFSEVISCDSFPWEKAIELVQEKSKFLKQEMLQLEDLNIKLEGFLKALEKKNCDS